MKISAILRDRHSFWGIFYLVFKIAFALFFVLAIGMSVFVTLKINQQRTSTGPLNLLGQVYVMPYETLPSRVPQGAFVYVREPGSLNEGDLVLFLQTTTGGERSLLLIGEIAGDPEVVMEGDEMTLAYPIRAEEGSEDLVRVSQDSIVGVPSRISRFPVFFLNLVKNPWTLIFVLIVPAVVLVMLEMSGLASMLRSRDPEEEAKGPSVDLSGYDPKVVEEIDRILEEERKGKKKN